MKRVQFHPEAREEMIAAAHYYEYQMRGLGRRYLDHVASTTDRIRNMPESYPKLDQVNRRARVPRFPFNIIFREKGDHIQVIAVCHFRRRPGYWTHRTDS